MSRFAGVERQNRDFYDRYHDIERENNNLANLYVASFQLHSTMELRELTQIILEILLNFVGAKTFAIQLVDEEHGKLSHAGGRRHRARQGARGRRRPRGASARSSERAPLHRRRAAAQRADLQHLDRPVIVVPLKIRDRVVGVVIIWDLLSQKTALADVDYELFNLLGCARGVGAAGRLAGRRARRAARRICGPRRIRSRGAMSTALVVEDSPTMRQLHRVRAAPHPRARGAGGRRRRRCAAQAGGVRSSTSS